MMYVDALEDGKIVHVSEDYARSEGLVILQRPMASQQQEQHKNAGQTLSGEKKDLLPFEQFRKPLKYKQNNILTSLADNFQWQISYRRREMHMTRKQLASAVGVSENDIKMLENGVLPADDYIIINKVQEKLGLHLRRDGFSAAPGRTTLRKPLESASTMLGDDSKLSEPSSEPIKASEQSSQKDEIEIIE